MLDTHPDAERVQIELLRNMPAEERLRLGLSWSHTVRQLAWQAIERANPGASREELGLIFVAVHYGQDLADRVRAYLAERHSKQDQ